MRALAFALLAGVASGSSVGQAPRATVDRRSAADTAQTVSISSLISLWEEAGSAPNSAALDFRIIGGTRQPTSLPWFANIMVVNEVDTDGAKVSQCGGSLISPTYVLTAAHCFFNSAEGVMIKPRNYTFDKNEVPNVILQIGGTKDQLFQNGRALEGKNDFVKRFAAKIQCNPGFDDFKYEKDVCLLKLNAPVLAKTVKLNFVTPTRTKQQVDSNKKPSTVVTAYGFGNTKSGGESSPDLMKAKLLVVPPATCQKKWKPLDLNYATLQSTTICVQSEPRDTCQGDSGGPLMNDGAGVQVGITSFGIDCASGIPAIYTNVAAYQPFIEGIVKDLPPQ